MFAAAHVVDTKNKLAFGSRCNDIIVAACGHYLHVLAALDANRYILAGHGRCVDRNAIFLAYVDIIVIFDKSKAVGRRN